MLVDEQGRPLARPRRRDFASDIEFIRAYHAYKDRIATIANDAFTKSISRGSEKTMINIAQIESTKTPELFDAISYNETTGEIAYPKPEGFTLDLDRVYTTTALFLPHCHGSIANAVRHAVYAQIIAFRGMAPIRRLAGI